MGELVVYSQEELKKIQQLELECLKAVISVCEESGIEYFADGGTALGAVRHGGFIPWDDDVDIAMTRENYRRFIEIAESRLPSKYHLQSPYNDKNSPYPYTKVRIDGTEFVEYCNRNTKIHHGVYIDIFPFDEVPDDDQAYLAQHTLYQKLLRKFKFRQESDIVLEPTNGKERIRSLLRRMIHIVFQATSRRKILDQMEHTSTQYNGTNQSAFANLNTETWKNDYIKKEALYPLRDAAFEDITIKIPNDYDRYLTNVYGNYMEFPPEDQRYGHKPYRVNLG